MRCSMGFKSSLLGILRRRILFGQLQVLGRLIFGKLLRPLARTLQRILLWPYGASFRRCSHINACLILLRAQGSRHRGIFCHGGGWGGGGGGGYHGRGHSPSAGNRIHPPGNWRQSLGYLSCGGNLVCVPVFFLRLRRDHPHLADSVA